ncbi:MAG TPA: hypothetical protein VHB02_06280 [Acidimicrobiales bacterium]|nr:hypothetical protein [Acidimicrobiales bacterium]
MTVTDLVPVKSDAAALEADPVAYMAAVLHRAKGWLQEAQSIDDVRHTKAIAVGYENVIREKEMAFDAQLAATEIVRRCERRIGQLVRKGQEEGSIRAPGSDTRTDLPDRVHHVVPGPREAVGATHRSELEPLYRMADSSDDSFDQAIEEAKQEGNLSRANVVRKVKGDPGPRAERDSVHYRAPRLNLERVLRESTSTLEALAATLETVSGMPLTPQAAEWLNRATEASHQVGRSLRAVRRKGER